MSSVNFTEIVFKAVYEERKTARRTPSQTWDLLMLNCVGGCVWSTLSRNADRIVPASQLSGDLQHGNIVVMVRFCVAY